MSFRSQKPATKQKVFTLALNELVFVYAWSALSGALFFSFTSLWIYALIPGALLSILVLASIEMSVEGNPLVGLSIRQVLAKKGTAVTKKRVFFRILISVVLFPVALLPYIPLFFNKLSLPELVTGLRLVGIDRMLDPRPRSVIKKEIKSANTRFKYLSYIPMLAAIAAFALLHSSPKIKLLQQETQEIQTHLSEEDQLLLTNYLELINLHPEELEYHVRIASLYHRNDMRQDLLNELEIISRIDSTHAILLLADTSFVQFNDLIAVEDTVVTEENWITPLVTPAATDSTESDSTEVNPDSLNTDTLVLQIDSILTDTLVTLPETNEDLILEEIDPLTEELPETGTEVETETETAVSEDLQASEEETVESDTLIQP